MPKGLWVMEVVWIAYGVDFDDIGSDVDVEMVLAVVIVGQLIQLGVAAVQVGVGNGWRHNGFDAGDAGHHYASRFTFGYQRHVIVGINVSRRQRRRRTHRWRRTRNQWRWAERARRRRRPHLRLLRWRLLLVAGGTLQPNWLQVGTFLFGVVAFHQSDAVRKGSAVSRKRMADARPRVADRHFLLLVSRRNASLESPHHRIIQLFILCIFH